MNLETKITIYKFTPQLFTLTQSYEMSYLLLTLPIPDFFSPVTRGSP